MLCTTCEHKTQCEATRIPLHMLSRLIIMSSAGATRENMVTIYDEFRGEDLDRMYRIAAAVEAFCPLAAKKDGADRYETSA